MRLNKKISGYISGVFLLIVCGTMAGCGNSGGSSGSVVSQNGTLSFSKSSINVTKGSTQTIILSLSSAESNISASVDVASANTSIASVSPSTCSLSNTSTLDSSCVITITGITNNQTTISAVASGYTSASANVIVGSDSVAGTLSFAESTTPIYVTESSAAYLTLQGSSGVTNDLINLTSSNPAITVSPTSCTLSTASNLCTVALNASSSATSTITATSALTGSVATMQAVASTTPTVGVLNLLPSSVTIAASKGSQSTSSNIRLTNSAGVHNLWVSVSNNSNASVAEPGNIVQNSVPVGYCCLSSNAESNTCSFNAVGQGAVGTTKITWSAVANGAGSCPALNATPTAYNPVTLNVTAATIQPVARTITVVNNCSSVVYFGISGGAVGNSASSQSDCPANSTYVPAKSGCFWNNPVPSGNNYALAANGGSTSVSIAASDYNGQQWSGGIAGRAKRPRRAASRGLRLCARKRQHQDSWRLARNHEHPLVPRPHARFHRAERLQGQRGDDELLLGHRPRQRSPAGRRQPALSQRLGAAVGQPRLRRQPGGRRQGLGCQWPTVVQPVQHRWLPR